MSINSKDYRLPPDKKVDLGKWPTIVAPYYKSKEQYQELLEQHTEKLSSVQQLHYASHRYALLLIFQGMDGAGKDGAIRHVMSIRKAARSSVSNSQARRNCGLGGLKMAYPKTTKKRRIELHSIKQLLAK